MNALSLALVILRRYIWYALFVVFGVAFLLYVVGGFIQYTQHVRTERQTLSMIDADVIAPKGSSVEHLRRLLRLEVFSEPALIPAQLYTTLTTDTPEGLQLTPVLFWGRYHDVPVIAADKKLQDILGTDFSVDSLGEREVLIGKNVAARFGLKAGDKLNLEANFGTLAGEPYRDEFQVKDVVPLSIWNGAILTSLGKIGTILSHVHFVKNQIWNDTILSYIFVTGPERWLGETKQLIDKRTVAQDLRLSSEVPGLLKLSGIDEHLELEVLIFALLSSVISLFAFLAIWMPLLARTYRKLIRSGYSTHQLLLCFQALGFSLLFLAAGLAALASYIHPIL
jgi:hypothetical protein